MNEFNIFTGKTVDEAISAACRFFGTERDKLVVEILSGGSTGIFGLVGKKKAEIKARRRHDPAVAALLENEERAGEPAPRAETNESKPRAETAGRERPRGKSRGGKSGKPQSAVNPKAEEAAPEQAFKREQRAAPEPRAAREPSPNPVSKEAAPQQRAAREPVAAPAAKEAFAEQAFPDDDLAEAPDEAQHIDASPASPELLAKAQEIMERLVTPILGEKPVMAVDGTTGRVNVTIDDEKHSGLLIGREGQTLAALQYLANRILARRVDSPVRLRLNTGEYREKQDDNLRKLAIFLADKTKSLGRPQSTRPLSSYHRRVIHMTLQDDETVQTRSKGEGAMKRVIISLKRSNP